MINQDAIFQLKNLILDYEKLVEESDDLESLLKDGDPSGDPSMQYCKENEIEEAKSAIESFIKELKDKHTA